MDCSGEGSSGAAMKHLYRSCALALLVTVGMCVGCGGSDSSSSTTTSTALISDTLPGTVPAPIGGVRQAASVIFNVNAPGGTVAVTLTSAVETNPDGSVNPNVVMGVGVGTPAAGACSLGTGNVPALLQAGANATLSGTTASGLYCVQVSDVTNQLGPVAFTVVVQHP
jgi:hypothetical protein